MILPALENDLSDTILVARIDARKAALASLALSSSDIPPFDEEDRARALTIAKSLSGAMGLAALVLFRQGKADASRVSIGLQDYRFRRVAATEIPNAYSRGHFEAVQGSGILTMWDSTLESATCDLCAKMHGSLAPFVHNLYPGDTHPSCRCIPLPLESPE